MELAIRYELANPGATDDDIAAHLGLTANQIRQWRVGPEYKNLKSQIVTGIISSVDIDVAEQIKFNRLKLEQAVPLALDNLVDLALQRTNAQLRFKASTEILDRHGHFAKVSRIGLPTEGQGAGVDPKDNEIASTLIDAISKGRAAEAATNAGAVTQQDTTNEVKPTIQ